MNQGDISAYIWFGIIGFFLVFHIISSPTFWAIIAASLFSTVGILFPICLGLIALLIHLISIPCNIAEQKIRKTQTFSTLKRLFDRIESFIRSDEVDQFLDTVLYSILGICVFSFSIFMFFKII